MPIDISQLSQMGVAALSVYLMWRLSTNHLDHNTKVLGELRDAINKLIEFLEKHG